MSASTHRLLVLLAALCLLLGLPVAGASAKGRHHHHHHAHKLHRKHKRHKQHRHKHHPTTAALGTPPAGDATDSTDDDTATGDRIGVISAISGDLVTVTLDAGGTETATVDENTEIDCAGSDDSADDPGNDDSSDDQGDDSSDDSGDDDPGDDRQAAICAPAVGDPVYEADLDDDPGLWDLLDLSGDNR